MCGVCAILGPWADTPQAGAVLRAMLTRLRHRGPDGQGQVSGPGFRLGHVRLAVLDPAGGAQPVSDAESGLTLACNGQIYNHEALRAELSGLGHAFRTRGDAEVLLAAWKEWGPACLHRLLGMFAFVLHDGHRQEVHAVTDHFGIKPLYWTELADGLTLASEIKALFCLPGLRPDLDRGSLEEYLTLQFTLGGSLFQGVRRLPPATRLVWRPGGSGPELIRYWEPDYAPDFSWTAESWAGELRALLAESARLQVRADVPVGAYLSGGLDSSSVVSLAALAGARPPCFTGRFAEGPAYDESAHATAVAEALGLEQYVCTPTAGDFAAHLPAILAAMDEPAAGPGLFSQYMTAGLAARRVKVVLGGLGGDELFAGYARHLVVCLEEALGAAARGEALPLGAPDLTALAPALPGLAGYLPMLRAHLAEGAFGDPAGRYFRLMERGRGLESVLAPEVYLVASRERVRRDFTALFNAPGPASTLARMSRCDRLTLLPALLQVEDRVNMAWSLEARVPLLDWRVASLAARVPSALMLAGGMKGLLRRAMRDIVPDSALRRRDKMGFPTPFALWAAGPLRDWLQDILLSPSARQRGVFHPPSVQALLDSPRSGGRRVWSLLCLELWFRTWKDL